MLRVNYRWLSAAPIKLQVAIIGSGPSGCYTADHLLKKCGDYIHVDVYDKMPVPFGLVRYGVAPDHPEVKNVEDRFLKMFTEDSKRVSWLGNVDVGRILTIAQLRSAYHAVVLATGASDSRKLHIPGEELANIFSARQFVNYYNTLPAPYCNALACPFKMAEVRRAVIIGNGNVALDIARVLGAHYKHWCPTDMNARAIRDLMTSNVEEIDIIARRGEEHAAFTTAEFREIATTFSNDEIEVRLKDFDLEAALKRSDGTRARKRMLELMHRYTESNLPQRRAEAMEKAKKQQEEAAKLAAEELRAIEAMKDSDDPNERYRYWQQSRMSLTNAFSVTGKPLDPAPNQTKKKRVINFCFGMRPVAFLPRPERRNFVGGVEVEMTDPTSGAPIRVVCPADVVFTSVGYRSEPIRGVPFDDTRGIIPNIQGRVDEGTTTRGVDGNGASTQLGGLYCVGWVKRGPKGVILHAMMDAQETASKILEDLGVVSGGSKSSDVKEVVPGEAEAAAVGAKPALTQKRGKFDLFDYLVSKEIVPLTIKGAKRIFEVERDMGADLGKRLEKMNSVQQMLDVGMGGEIGHAAGREFRGLSGARPKQAKLLSAFLDDTTDMRPIAEGFSKGMPGTFASTEFVDSSSVPEGFGGVGGGSSS